jgi:hypothetical protein
MDETITGRAALQIDGTPMSISFTVPKGPCGPEALLPAVQRLANQVTDHAEARANRAGLKISCAKGCGACCRQTVPISPVEARHLAALVNAMPPDRAEKVRLPPRPAARLDRPRARGGSTAGDPRIGSRLLG